MKRFFLLSGLAGLACGLAVARASDDARPVNWTTATEILARIHRPTFPAHDFKITDFGAAADGATNCTAAIRAAITACAQAGGGRVIVPTGTFLTGAITLQSNVNLHLEDGATLRFLLDPAAYLPMVRVHWEGIECLNYSPFIYAYNQENIAVTGHGTLDGSASESVWWNRLDKSPGHPAPAILDAIKLNQLADSNTPVEQRRFGAGHFLRPNFFEPFRCRNVLIEGVTFLRSPMWEINPVLCTNVTVTGVTIDSLGPNNDGCDPDSCRDVLIEKTSFSTGDDCIAIKSGRNDDGRRAGVPAENHVIRDCTMKDGHGGLVIGSEIAAGCRNIFLENCVMDSPQLGRVVRFKSNAQRGGITENVFVRNVKVGRVAEAIVTVDFLYEEGSHGSFPPTVRNVQLDNVTCESCPRVFFVASFPAATIDDFRFSNCTFRGLTANDVVQYTRRISYDNVSLIPAVEVHSLNSRPPIADATAPAGSKKIVKSQSDLPRFSYPLKAPASALVRNGGPEFDALAAQVRTDLHSIFQNYQIEDHSTLRTLLSARLDLEELSGDDAAALKTVNQIRDLQDKPAAKLLSGLAARAILEAALETHSHTGVVFDNALRRRYLNALTPLPWAIVEDSIKRSHVGARIFTASVAIADTMTELDPAVRTSGALDAPEAWDLIDTRVAIVRTIPTSSIRAHVLEDYIAAHPTVAPNIWTAREVTLTPDQNLTPTVVAIWDSGIDLKDFPGQVFDDQQPTPSGKHGVAFDDQGSPSSDWLYPLSPEQQAAYPEFQLLSQGRLDIEHGLDSPAAQAVTEKYTTLAPEALHDFFELEKVLGFYIHGTHCAGISVRGNPAARLAAARFDDQLSDMKFPPTEEWVRKMGSDFAAMAEFFRTRHVRVVNMSWGDQPQEFERWLDKTGGGGDPAARKKTAAHLFHLWSDAVKAALESCPDVLFVTAAGNSDSNPGFDDDIPASFHLPNLIAVGAVNQAGEETSFTSFGDSVVVDANGYEVDSTIPGGARLRESGTSMASPNVVNLAAKLFALNPKLTPEQAIHLIRLGATPSPNGRLHLIDERKSVDLLRTATNW